MKFRRRLIDDWCGRGSSSFFQPEFPAVAEHVAFELDLFDCWRKSDIDRHDLNSANTILNVRAGIKNRRSTRHPHHDVLAVTEINLALQRKINIFSHGIQEFERSVVAVKCQPSARPCQIERSVLQNSV